MTNVDLDVTVMDQGKASVIRIIVGEAGCIAGSARSIRFTPSNVREEAELRSLLADGESGTRRYEGGKARSKQR